MYIVHCIKTLLPKQQNNHHQLPLPCSTMQSLAGNAVFSKTSPNPKACLIALAVVSIFCRWAYQGPVWGWGFRSHNAGKVEEGTPAHLDRSLQFQIVVAHNKARPHAIHKWLGQVRNVPNIADLGVGTTIYTKGHIHDLDEFRNITGSDEIFRLRDRGREAGTYLHHIIKNYDNLANYTFFTHEEPIGIAPETGAFDEAHYDALRYVFDNQTIFMNHGLNEEGVGWCHCGDCEGHAGSQYPLMKQIMSMLSGEACHGRQRTILFNQFIVARERIVARPKWIYNYLLELVTAPKDHWIHKQEQPADVLSWMGGKSTPEHPLFLYTIERLWSGLFECDEDPWAEGCKMFLDRDGPAENRDQYPSWGTKTEKIKKEQIEQVNREI